MTVTESFDVPAGVVFDLYRDIHKAIRAELFRVTLLVGQLDPADDAGRTALGGALRELVRFLDQHAEHEDGNIGPLLTEHLPALEDEIERDHADFDRQGAYLIGLAETAADALPGDRRPLLQHLYLDLAAFSSCYLRHQDLEERQVMPALQAAVGPDAVLAVHQQIIGSIPPEEMGSALVIMLPAMNVDDRTEMLGGMQAGAPPEVFQGIWNLAGTILGPDDHAVLGARLGLS